MNPTLIIIDSMGCIIREDLNRFRKDVIAFGRSEQRNDIVVSDGFISGNHGVFIRQNGRFYYTAATFFPVRRKGTSRIPRK